MKKLLIVYLIFISFSVNAQDNFINGFKDGFSDECQEEGLELSLPSIPRNYCTYDDYRCGYRLGVKSALLQISEMSLDQKASNREIKKWKDDYEKSNEEALNKAEEIQYLDNLNETIKSEYEKTINNLKSGPQGYPLIDGYYTSLYIDGPSSLKYKRGPSYTASLAPSGGNAFLSHDPLNGCEKRIRWKWSHPEINFRGEVFGVGNCDQFNGGESDKPVTVNVSTDRKTIIVKFIGMTEKTTLRLRHHD